LGLQEPIHVTSGGYRGVAMVSAEIPSENVRAPYPINKWTGGRYFLCNSSSEGIQEVAEYW